MDNYRLLLQKIINKLNAYYEFNKERMTLMILLYVQLKSIMRIFWNCG